MTAATETSREDHSVGNLRAVTARFATLDDEETWDTGLSAIIWVGVTDEAAAAGYDLGCTWSGGTVTFQVEGPSTVAAKAIAVGF